MLTITFWAILVVAIISQGWAYLIARKSNAIELGTPLSLPNWDFKSLVTNLGITASVTVPAFSLLGELAKGKDNEFLRWTLVAGILIWFAPLAFLVWRGNNAGQGKAPEYFGYVFFYLIYAVFATAGLASQLAILGLMLNGNKADATSMTIASVTLFTSLLVIIYGGRTSYLILLAAAPSAGRGAGTSANDAKWSLL